VSSGLASLHEWMTDLAGDRTDVLAAATSS
jgi:hypothetical protein